MWPIIKNITTPLTYLFTTWEMVGTFLLPVSQFLAPPCIYDTTRVYYTRLTALFLALPGWASTRKVKPIWILLKQETVSGSGWAICKSAPSSRQMTTPAPHHSVFYRPDALPVAQATASKHWRPNSVKSISQYRRDEVLSSCGLFSDSPVPCRHQRRSAVAPWTALCHQSTCSAPPEIYTRATVWLFTDLAN